MDKLRFIFSETIKTLCLLFLGLVTVKAVGSLQARSLSHLAAALTVWVRGVLYAATLALVGMGARGLGVEISAGFRSLAFEDDVIHLRTDTAFSNALRAVQLRPGIFLYWRNLSVAKFILGQFNSVLKDEPVFLALSGGHLDEETSIRFAYCHYFLGQYDQVFPLTERVIEDNRVFTTPYVIEGMTYTAQKKYAAAERRFLGVLQLFPTQQAALEGLAHVHYLMGNPGSALEVLNETAKFPFPPEARKRFAALKAFYGR